MKPSQTPNNPCFSSGPCAKRPGWNFDALKNAALGRSHRAKIGKNKLADVIERSKKVLGMPETYVLGIVPASDTGAVEMALWSMLGERGVDILTWEAFSAGWATAKANSA
jgi:phosphoserine aminotransferase